jgi:hypothetical protein
MGGSHVIERILHALRSKPPTVRTRREKYQDKVPISIILICALKNLFVLARIRVAALTRLPRSSTSFLQASNGSRSENK